MEFITSTVKYYEDYSDTVVTCKIKAPEVDKIIKDFNKCLKENLPGWSFRKFVLVNFWNPDNDYYSLPSIIQCSTKKVASGLYSELLHHLDYNDPMRGCYCSVHLNENKIFITFGEY